MPKTNRILFTFFITLAMMAFAPALMALQQDTLEFWEEVSCESENIEIEGTVRFQEHFVGGDNHSTFVLQAIWKGMGYGLESGEKYRLSGKWMTVEQIDPPYTLIINDHFQLIGKGKAQNYRFFFKVKVVVNANGETSVEFFDDENPCDYVDGSF